MSENQRAFVGKWITSERFCDLVPVNVFHRQLDVRARPAVEPILQNRHVLFRRQFVHPSAVRTEIFITADDYYKLYVNGVFVNQGPTASYSFHYWYNRIDISAFLQPGCNIIAVHTYYQGLINRVWVSGDSQHGLLLDVVADGQTVVCSDESFRQHEHTGFLSAGKAGYETQFLERYDAKAPEVGFEQPEFDDSAWKPARIRKQAPYDLFEQPSSQLDFDTIVPLAMSRHGDIVRVDFGGVYVGSLRFCACGRAGDEVVMRFGQERNDDGSVRYRLRANCVYEEYLTFSGWRDTLNQFDYKAFRYVDLEFPSGAELDDASVVLVARHYPFVLRAECQYRDPAAQAIWKLCVDTLHYGVQEVIQDCMEREKGYYLGDGCYSLLTFCLLNQDFTLCEKFFDDFLRTSFINRGLMTCSGCSLMQEIAEYPFIMMTLLLEYCVLTGNLEFIRPRFAAFADILDFYRETYSEADGLLSHLDKWCVVEWPKNMRDGYDVDLAEGKVCRTKHNVINAYYIGAVKCLNKIARQLGLAPYGDAETLQKAFADAFYVPGQHLFRDSAESDHVSMPGNVFAYFFDLFPDPVAGKQSILAMVREKRLTQSLFFVTFPLFCGLIRDGEESLVYDLLTDRQAWLNMLSEGATRTFEGWSRDLKWNTSLFHLTLAYGAAFLTEWDIPEIFNFRS
ncbi:MAG: family 78 glycoside hydrolase catalytic domain [Lentisphaeria bacterium]